MVRRQRQLQRCRKHLQLALVTVFLLLLCFLQLFTSSVMLHPYSPAQTQYCLVHSAQNISESFKIEAGILRQATNQCGRLKRDWSNNEPHSKFAKWMLKHQSDCTKSFATHYLDNTCKRLFVYMSAELYSARMIP